MSWDDCAGCIPELHKSIPQTDANRTSFVRKMGVTSDKTSKAKWRPGTWCRRARGRCPARAESRPCGRLRPLTAALRSVPPVPGNSARFGLEHDHVTTFSFSRFFPSRSRCRGRLPSGQCRRGVADCAARARRTDARLRSADFAAGGARFPAGQAGGADCLDPT